MSVEDTSVALAAEPKMRKAIKIITNNIVAYALFLLINNPIINAFIAAGRKSNPAKYVGFPKTNVNTVPNIILALPTYGPNIIPYIGAIASDNEKAAPDIPTTGIV